MNTLIFLFWILSIILIWFNRKRFSKNIEIQGRVFIYYINSTSILLLFFIGENFGISNDYLFNLITELLGILITVALIDTIYNYIHNKKEESYRKTALRLLKMPIFTYCINWFYLYQETSPQNTIIAQKFNSLEDFFYSQDFFDKVKSFDFNRKISSDKTYATYYDESFEKVKEQFQNILAKYASKISDEDVKLIEHFGGSASIFKIFKINVFLCNVKFSKTDHKGNKESLTPNVNEFKSLNHENFKSHFEKLILLINEYNSVSEDYNKWNINTLTILSTIEKENLNPNIEW